MGSIPVQQLLEVLARFDKFGGANPGLAACDLFVDEQELKPAWEHIITAGWLVLAGHGKDDMGRYIG